MLSMSGRVMGKVTFKGKGSGEAGGTGNGPMVQSFDGGAD
jgi:hypothetical protein